MGKLLDKYKAEYQAAIAPGLAKGHNLVVPPELWMYFKWEEDTGVQPWDKINHYKALSNAMLQDPEFGQVLTIGMQMAMSALDATMKGKEGS